MAPTRWYVEVVRVSLYKVPSAQTKVLTVSSGWIRNQDQARLECWCD